MIAVLIILGLFVGGVGLFCIWYGWMFIRASNASRQTDATLAKEGVKVEAEIINQRWASRYRSAPYYFITYTYSYQDQAFREERAIHSADYHRLKVGDHIAVLLLPSNPKTHIIISGAVETFNTDQMRLSGGIIVGVGMFVCLLGAAMPFIPTGEAQRSATSTAYLLQLSATPNVAEKTATVVAATATAQTDQTTVAAIKAGLTSRLGDLKEAADTTMKRLRGAETGLGLGEIEIDYGLCPKDQFYVYIWLRITDRLKIGNELDTYFDGYGYVEGANPADCYPKELAQVWLRASGSLGGDWYAVSGATEQKLEK